MTWEALRSRLVLELRDPRIRLIEDQINNKTLLTASSFELSRDHVMEDMCMITTEPMRQIIMGAEGSLLLLL